MVLINHFGTEIEAELIEVDDSGVSNILVFNRVADGKRFEYPLSDLIKENQTEILDWWKQEKMEREMLTADDDLELDVKLKRRKPINTSNFNEDHDAHTYFPEITIKNEAINKNYSGNKLILVCMAESTLTYGNRFFTNRYYTIAYKAEKQIDIKASSELVYVFDSYDLNSLVTEGAHLRRGLVQAAYFCAIVNSKGEITHIKTDNSDFKDSAANILNAEFAKRYDKWFERTLEIRSVPSSVQGNFHQ